MCGRVRSHPGTGFDGGVAEITFDKFGGQTRFLLLHVHVGYDHWQDKCFEFESGHGDLRICFHLLRRRFSVSGSG